MRRVPGATRQQTAERDGTTVVTPDKAPRPPFSLPLTDGGTRARHPRGLSLAGLSACLLLSACLGLGRQEGPKTTLEAGTTSVAVTFVAPWDDFVDSLSPGFTITGDKALERVLPTTARQDRRQLRAFAASLGVGVPQSFSTSIHTNAVDEEGKETTTSSRTRERKPGKAPEAAVSSVPGDRTAEEPQGLSAEVLENDPLLQYQTASSLFQEIRFLNNQLRFAPMHEGYTPYIIRLQLNVTPFWRDLEYDVYSTISFFSGRAATNSQNPSASQTNDQSLEKKQPTRMPIVVPLLVSDNLEGSNSQRLRNTIRELGLALNFLSTGVAGNLSLKSLNERLENIIGTDLNSLLNVSRVNDNTIQVRLGAAVQPSANGRHAQIPRNHNISVLVLFPDPPPGGANTQTALITSRTDFRSIKNGKFLPTADSRGYHTQRKTILEWFYKNCFSDENFYKEANNLVEQVEERNYDKFKKEILNKEGQPCAGPQHLWAAVSALSRFGQPYGFATFELPKVTEPTLESAQTALLRDDGQTIRTRLIGGAGLKAARIRATLTVSDTKIFPAQSIAVHGDKGAQRLDLVFESPKAWGVKPDWKDVKIHVKQIHPRASARRIFPLDQGFNVVHLTHPAKTDHGFALRSQLHHVHADKTGKGSLTIHVEKLQKKKLDRVAITVSNANLIGLKASVSAGAKFDMSTERITLSDDAAVSLSLSNLAIGKTVTIKAVGMKGEKSLGEGLTLAFDVVR